MDIETLEALELRDADGAAHRIGDFFAERKVALVFLRHFG